MEKKIFSQIIVILLMLAMIPNVSSQPSSPVGVGGYIINDSGVPCGGQTVRITNNNTGLYAVVISDSNGLYACGLNASNGDILFGSCTGGLGGTNQTIANLSNVTQWLNITITILPGGGGGPGGGGTDEPTTPSGPGEAIVQAVSYLWFAILAAGICAVIIGIYIYGFAKKKKKKA